mmetsp:Transcript_37937/g.60080  ORF Transcript_37937/g.60080 Transcript_37937/m.60080 type:complete len:235 (+) Transcript_37937:78-782(+)
MWAQWHLFTRLLVFSFASVGVTVDSPSASLILYDLERTLMSLSTRTDGKALASSWTESHLQRIRTLGSVPVGLPSEQLNFTSLLTSSALSHLLGDVTIPKILGTFGVYGDVKWTQGLAPNATTHLKTLLKSAIYVGSNSFLVDRIVRKGLAHHAVWVSQDGFTPEDAALVEEMAADLSQTRRCTQPVGAPTWSDFLCCARPACDIKHCCTARRVSANLTSTNLRGNKFETTQFV